MEKTEPAPQKQRLIDPIYKSTLVYRPSDYLAKDNYFDDEDDLESQKEDERSMLADRYAERRAKRRRGWGMCCCCLCYIVFILLLVAAIIVVKLIPKDPSLSLGQLDIIQFVPGESVSHNNGQQQQQLKVQLSYNLNVTNRNPHADAIYKNISLSLFFSNESLGTFKVSPEQFEQKRKNTTTIVANLPGTVIDIQNSANAATLKSQEASQNVQVTMTGNVIGTFKVLGVKVKNFNKEILCMLNIKPGDGGSKQASLLTTVCYS